MNRVTSSAAIRSPHVVAVAILGDHVPALRALDPIIDGRPVLSRITCTLAYLMAARLSAHQQTGDANAMVRRMSRSCSLHLRRS